MNLQITQIDRYFFLWFCELIGKVGEHDSFRERADVIWIDKCPCFALHPRNNLNRLRWVRGRHVLSRDRNGGWGLNYMIYSSPFLITKMFVDSDSPFGEELHFIWSPALTHSNLSPPVLAAISTFVMREIKLFEQLNSWIEKKYAAKHIREQIELPSFLLDSLPFTRPSSNLHETIKYACDEWIMAEWSARHRHKFDDANGVWYWWECENDQIQFVPHVLYDLSRYLVGTRHASL